MEGNSSAHVWFVYERMTSKILIEGFFLVYVQVWEKIRWFPGIPYLTGTIHNVELVVLKVVNEYSTYHGVEI